MRYPNVRLRRLRENPLLRDFVAQHTLLKKELVQPLFIKENLSRPVEIPSMPGQFQWTPAAAVDEAARVHAMGLPAILLFGIPEKKDEKGRAAFAKSGVIQKAVTRIKKHCPKLLVITDVCLCEYLSHGHCGHVKKGRVLNDPTLATLSRAALSHARAGADVVAPSDMMDGRVLAIRTTLDRHGFQHLPILSYAVKYASAFYGPFRQAAESSPAFGDRAGYQMNPANANEAIREAGTDLAEGADLLLVKPGLAYLDILHRVKQKFSAPTGAFAVSGEYAMIKAAAGQGWIDEKKTVMETHLAMKRAGADFLVTYWAKSIARWQGAAG